LLGRLPKRRLAEQRRLGDGAADRLVHRAVQ
jgi:hypothetical protein